MVTADCQVSRRKRMVVDWAGFGEAIVIVWGLRGWSRAGCPYPSTFRSYSWIDGCQKVKEERVKSDACKANNRSRTRRGGFPPRHSRFLFSLKLLFIVYLALLIINRLTSYYNQISGVNIKLCAQTSRQTSHQQMKGMEPTSTGKSTTFTLVREAHGRLYYGIGRNATRSKLKRLTNEGPLYSKSCSCRESDGRTFDWFLSPSYLVPFFEELTADIDAGKDARILMLGCGNSALGEVLYDAGWKNIVNIDVSRRMQQWRKGRQETNHRS